MRTAETAMRDQALPLVLMLCRVTFVGGEGEDFARMSRPGMGYDPVE
jgi:hypothetical protein